MKYELTDDCIEYTGRTLHRIRALKDFGIVKKGDLGGYIESVNNLSQDGSAWVYDEAKISRSAEISGNVKIMGNAVISDSAKVYGKVIINGEAKISGSAEISGNAMIYGNAVISDSVKILSNAMIGGTAVIKEKVNISDTVKINGTAKISGKATICGNAEIYDNAVINKIGDYATVQGFGRHHRVTTFYRNKYGGVSVKCGCFYGSLDSFRERVKQTHGNSKLAKEYLMIADLMEYKFSDEKRS